MIRRTLDPAFLNEVCNHPKVHPWLGHEAPIDVGPALANPRNYALVTDTGGFILMWHEPGVYEVHSQFLPEAKGKAVTAMREGFEYMFTRTDAHTILSQVPDNNPAARALAKHARFRPLFRREDTPRGPTQYVGLTIDEWAQGNESLEAEGQWFHDRLEAAKKTTGSVRPTHDDDPAHERAVGAAVLMVKAGNCAKGVDFYNRWARLAGYATIGLVSDTPPTLDVVDAVVEVRGSDMEILLCR